MLLTKKETIVVVTRANVIEFIKKNEVGKNSNS